MKIVVHPLSIVSFFICHRHRYSPPGTPSCFTLKFPSLLASPSSYDFFLILPFSSTSIRLFPLHLPYPFASFFVLLPLLRFLPSALLPIKHSRLVISCTSPTFSPSHHSRQLCQISGTALKSLKSASSRTNTETLAPDSC